MDNLNPVPQNKTYGFYTPLEGNNSLVRTGTIYEKILCFFNAVLLSCSRNFIKLNPDEQYKVITKVKNSIHNKLHRKEWETIGAKPFIKLLYETLTDFYTYINTNTPITNQFVKKIGKQLIKTKKDFELFRIITDILPIDIIMEQFDSENNIDSLKKNIKKCVKEYLITNDMLNQIDDKNNEHIIKNISIFLNLVLDEVEYLSFKNFKYNIEVIDEKLVDIVSDYFSCNVYFLDSKTRLPYIKSSLANLKHLKSIIILDLGNEHYESVCRLEPATRVYEFLYDDILVTKMNKLIEIKYADRHIESDKEVNDEEKSSNEELSDEEESSNEEVSDEEESSNEEVKYKEENPKEEEGDKEESSNKEVSDKEDGISVQDVDEDTVDLEKDTSSDDVYKEIKTAEVVNTDDGVDL